MEKCAHRIITHKLLVYVFLFKSLLVVIVASCDPLVQREGIRVQCKNAAGARVNCYAYAHPGTVARYGCESPYYYPVQSQRKPETLACALGGSWGLSAEVAHFNTYRCRLNCGVPNLEAVTSYIIKGSVTEPSNWPWHATIFLRSSSKAEFKYICGGTLIKPTTTLNAANVKAPSGFLVVTAAHCFGNTPRTSVLAHNVLVVLGTSEPILELRLNTSAQSQAQVFHVAEIVVHESYGGSGSVYQSDIALLHLQEAVRLGVNVLPACLSKNVGRPSVGRVGHITGFGVFDFELSQSQPASQSHSPELRTASIPVVHPDNCSEWRSHNRVLNTAQEFCAGTDGEQNACHGDSGGGMVFNATDEEEPSRPRFYLHGIVSHSRGEWNGKAASCDTFTVFTKVRSYIDWISEAVENFSPKSSSSSDTTSATTTTMTPTTKPTTASTPSTSFLSRHCGIRTAADELISKQSDWPWQASIMVRHGHRGLDEKDFVYSCDGSLIAASNASLIVLTAASCVTHANKTVHKRADLRVVLGLLEPLLEGMATHSPDASVLQVRKIVTHSSFAHAEAGTDLALVQLEMSAERKRISMADLTPVCLPMAARVSSPAVGDVGHIASYKLRPLKPPSPSTLRLTLSQFSVVDSEHCAASATAYSATNHFCGGNSSILSKACTGRRGAGMCFDRQTGPVGVGGVAGSRFFLEGVATRGKDSGWLKALTCRYGTYTRVSAYVDWIHENLIQMIS